jgi:hypothetical protein
MWHDTYTTALGLERTASMLARALGVDFEEQRSVLVGEWFRSALEDPVIEIKINYRDNDELVDPELPEGVWVRASGEVDSPLRATLAGLAYLTLLPLGD